jgi:hypothetical protein
LLFQNFSFGKASAYSIIGKQVKRKKNIGTKCIPILPMLQPGTIKPVGFWNTGVSCRAAGPGCPLRFPNPPAAGLRDFRFHTENAQGIEVEILFCLTEAGKKDWNG